jgi:hypothetical protein
MLVACWWPLQVAECFWGGVWQCCNLSQSVGAVGMQGMSVSGVVVFCSWHTSNDQHIVLPQPARPNHAATGKTTSVSSELLDTWRQLWLLAKSAGMAVSWKNMQEQDPAHGTLLAVSGARGSNSLAQDYDLQCHGQQIQR